MNLCSNNPIVERAQPWLGTLVSIRAEGLREPEAHRVIDLAFAEIAAVHRLMSFHDSGSDVSRLNRDAARYPVEVHPWTWSVLKQGQQFSKVSAGCFDVTVAAELVAWGLLLPPGEMYAKQRGSWSDIELLPGNRVWFRRPLWIDLGGIAKGFAVDRATECLREFGPSRTVVNAGGDLRVQGGEAESILLGATSSTYGAPVLELADGSAAGSCAAPAQRRHRGPFSGPHVDGTRRRPTPAGRFACVIAENCMTADALTKVAMAQGVQSIDVLDQYGASAWIKNPDEDWQHIGAAIG